MIALGWVYLGCGFVLLAIIINLVSRFDAQRWITRDLRRGDLYALIEVASGVRPDGLTIDQADRLKARGMVRVDGRHFRATLKGRFALLLRQLFRQRSDSITRHG